MNSPLCDKQFCAPLRHASGIAMTDEISFTVEMEIKRMVTATVVAKDVYSARVKAANLELKHQIDGEMTGWEIVSIAPTPTVE